MFWLEKAPEVEGGIELFTNWIAENNKLMGCSDTLRWEHFVAVKFMIDTTGSMVDVGVIKGIGMPYDNEAYRLISECPLKWKPGSTKEKYLSVRYTIPIRFIKQKNKRAITSDHV